MSESDKEYWKNWPLKCPYNDDLDWACKLAINYLMKIAPQVKASKKTGVVVFDIDDTLVMGDPASVLGLVELEYSKTDSHPDQDMFILPPNLQVVKVAEIAKKLDFQIVILTARPPSSKLASSLNLKFLQIPHNALIMNEKDQDPFFKINVRRSLETADRTVVLTIGDQPFDCFLPGKAASIKLPDPEMKCSYAYFP